MATKVASLYGVLTLNDKQFKSTLKGATSGLGGLSKKLKKTGKNVTNFGKQWTLAMAPIAAGLAVAIKKTHDFDRAMSNVNAILGIAGDEAKTLREEILQFGGSTVAGPQATAEAYYAIVSGVQDVTTHMAILEAATKTSEAGQADLMATTSGLIAVMNSYQLSAEDAAFVSDVFTRTVGMGVLTMDELANALPLVTGLSSAMGLSLEDTASQMAFLTTQGFDAGRSATFMKSMMTTLLNPTADLSSAIGALGYESGQAMVDALGLVGAYDAIKQYGGGAFDGLITNQEALQGALALTKDGANQFFTDYKTGVDGATAAAGEAQGLTEGWDLLRSSLDKLAIIVGTVLMPIISDLITTTIIPAVEAVSAWIGENPELAGQLVLLAAGAVVLGPLIWIVGSAISAAGAAVGLLKGAITLLLLPWKLWSIGAAALTIIKGGLLTVMGALNISTAAFTGTVFGLVAPLLAVAAAFLAVVAAAAKFNEVVLVPAGAAKTQIAADVASGGITDYSYDKHYDATWKAAYDEAKGAGQPHWAAEAAANTTATSLAALTYDDAVAKQAQGQGRASGGPVTDGNPYMVGERGPELFVPRSSGDIVPNDALGGGGDTYNTTVYANDYAGGEAAADGFVSKMKQLKRQRG